MDYATLFVTDTSLIAGKTLEHFKAIKSYTSKSDSKNTATGMVLKLNEAVIDCNFMEQDEIKNQLEGLQGFVHAHIKERSNLIYSLSRIRQVSMVIGCVINPVFDKKNNVLNFIKSYSNFIRCMSFYNDALWDYDGECLASLKNDK